MSRIAPPAEKITATAGIFKALSGELGIAETVAYRDPVVIASLIDAAVRIAMATDTRDIGILAPPPMTSATEISHHGYPDDD